LNNFDSWNGKGSYPKSSILGRNLEEPFKFNELTKSCEIQCDIENHFWVDWNYWRSTKLVIQNIELQNLSKETIPYTNVWQYENNQELTSSLDKNIKIHLFNIGINPG